MKSGSSKHDGSAERWARGVAAAPYREVHAKRWMRFVPGFKHAVQLWLIENGIPEENFWGVWGEREWVTVSNETYRVLLVLRNEVDWLGSIGEISVDNPREP